jgi:hypothetical protein
MSREGQYLDNRIMGILSDRLKARLDEMRELHAQTERELLESRKRVFEALDRLKATADELADD